MGQPARVSREALLTSTARTRPRRDDGNRDVGTRLTAPAILSAVRPCRGLPSSGQKLHPAGHWRAISPGVMGCLTVTSGVPDSQVGEVKGPDRSDSQADGPQGSAPGQASTRARS
jgi:hypothetical protein